MSSPWEEGICISIENGLGHAHDGRSYNFKILFSRTQCRIVLKLSRQHLGLKFYNVYINDDPGLTLTYLTARLILVIYAFELGKLLYVLSRLI